MAEAMTPQEREVQNLRDQVTAQAVQMIDHILDHGVLLNPGGLSLTNKGMKVAQLLDGMLLTMQKTIDQELQKLAPKFPS